MPRVCAFVLPLVLAAPVWAADWVTISRYSGMHLELDTSSVVPEGNAVLAWDRMSYSADRQAVESGDIAFRSARTQMRYDCVRRTVVPVLRSFSHEDGTEILNQNVEGAELPQTIVPDTPRERMFRIVCKGRPAKAGSPVAAAGGQEAGGDAAKPTRTAAGPAGKPDKGKPAQPAGKGGDKAGKPGESQPADPKAGTSKPGESRTAESKPADGKAPATKAADAKSAEGKAPSTAQATAPAKAEGGKAATAAPAVKADAHGKADAQAKADATGKADGHGKPDPRAKAEAHGKDAHGKDAGPGTAAKADAAGHGAPEAKDKVHAAHWAYSGNSGAQNWHKLSREYATCAEGKRQSPIDIKEGVRVQLDALKFDYKPSALKVVNNGHTIQVGYEPGSFVIVGDTPYELVQFHFHRPAEERVNGRTFDMVAHLVHKSKEGQLAVVAVLLMIGDEHPFIRTLWNHLPLDVGLEESNGAVKIDVSQLLPKIRGYYTYMGSLTTPPCTEGVRWIVMRTPVQVSRAQVTTFGRVYEMNARPLQASNGRLIKEVL